ncbi:MAG TPA: FAD-binding oxidoreductase [Polyangiaceae bacterium]|jgi:FAD/FMN-containing dehydrogenase
MSDHQDKLERVAAQLRAHDPSRPVSLRKRSVSHRVPKRDDATRHDDKIDIADLDRILAVDPETQTCTAEPGVTFVDLVRATLPLGLAPAIVPELETITIGGAVAGCSIESASFRYGGFHDTCLEYEIVTARGDVVRAKPDSLLFQMMHGTFGTLGILTELKFRLVPAKPFVHVVYETYATLSAYEAAIARHASEEDLDFMDGIIHSPQKFVLSLGRFEDRAPYTSRYDWMKIYWQSTGERCEDHMRTRDYFFRYDAGVTNVHPKSRVMRFLFGKFLRSSRLLRAADKLHFMLPKRPDVTVDLFLPLSKVDRFMDWYERELDHFPIWCVPYRRVRDYEWIAPRVFDGLPDELFLDLAIYGAKQRRGHDEYAEIEHELDELAALKTLISHNRYDEESFWRTWNKPNYDAVKKLTDPDGVFRGLYEKTCRAMQGAT